MSNIFEKNKKYIFIGVSILIVAGIIYYIGQKNSKVMNYIEDLKQRVEDLEDIVQKYEESLQKHSKNNIKSEDKVELNHGLVPPMNHHMNPPMNQHMNPPINPHINPQNMFPPHMSMPHMTQTPNIHVFNDQMNNTETSTFSPRVNKEKINNLSSKNKDPMKNKKPSVEKPKSPEIVIKDKKHISFNTQIEEIDENEEDTEENEEELDAELEEELKELETEDSD